MMAMQIQLEVLMERAHFPLLRSACQCQVQSLKRHLGCGTPQCAFYLTVLVLCIQQFSISFKRVLRSYTVHVTFYII